MSTVRRPESREHRFVLRHFNGHGRMPNATYHLALEQDAALAHHCTVIYQRATHCPRCAQLLTQEPGASACRHGCGRIWRIVGTSTTDQYEWERASGLIGERGDRTLWALER